MKKLIEFILVGTFILSANITKSENETNNPDSSMEKSDVHHHKEEDQQIKERTDYSIYNLQATWLTQYNKELRLNDLKGKVQVMAMFYSSCEYVCPRIVADMKRIESEIGQDHRDKFGFVLVSIDPKRDTPQKLKAFAIERNLDPKRWLLLHGNENDILELSALLGVKYKRVSETDFAHSNLITVLNSEGEIVHQQIGLGTKHTETIAAINKLIK